MKKIILSIALAIACTTSYLTTNTCDEPVATDCRYCSHQNTDPFQLNPDEKSRLIDFLEDPKNWTDESAESAAPQSSAVPKSSNVSAREIIEQELKKQLAPLRYRRDEEICHPYDVQLAAAEVVESSSIIPTCNLLRMFGFDPKTALLLESLGAFEDCLQNSEFHKAELRREIVIQGGILWDDRATLRMLLSSDPAYAKRYAINNKPLWELAVSKINFAKKLLDRINDATQK